MEFDVVKSYNTLDNFWSEFTSEAKWYMKFKYLNAEGRLSSKALLLAKHILSFFNELQRDHSFTYEEYGKISYWSKLVWSDEYKQTEIKQWCSNCYKEVQYRGEYPKYICGDCFSKNKFDSKGNLLEFSNLGFSGGFQITYKDINGNLIREDDTQESCECIIDNKLFIAREARLGGIVIQKKE